MFYFFIIILNIYIYIYIGLNFIIKKTNYNFFDKIKKNVINKKKLTSIKKKNNRIPCINFPRIPNVTDTNPHFSNLEFTIQTLELSRMTLVFFFS